MNPVQMCYNTFHCFQMKTKIEKPAEFDRYARLSTGNAMVEVRKMQKSDGYWSLFLQTGAPEFYLTYRMERDGAHFE